MDSDSKTTIQKLKQTLRAFRDERDWAQFHDPKNLAEAISIESSELLELFLWKNPKKLAKAIRKDPKLRRAVEEELADVICFSLSLANSADIDVTQAVLRKVESNKRKYPVAKARGSATKYDKL